MDKKSKLNDLALCAGKVKLDAGGREALQIDGEEKLYDFPMLYAPK